MHRKAVDHFKTVITVIYLKSFRLSWRSTGCIDIGCEVLWFPIMASNALHRQPPAPQHKRSQISRCITRPRRRRAHTQLQTVNVAATKAADESISISVDGYNLLQVCQSALHSGCLQLTAHQLLEPDNILCAGQQSCQQGDMLQEI